MGAGMSSRTLHFVGFRGDEYHRAARAFGRPDFIHRHYDERLIREVAPDDLVVFANGAELRFHADFSFNDSEHF